DGATSSVGDVTDVPDTAGVDDTGGVDPDGTSPDEVIGGGVCGNGVLEPGEACDDGNACVGDGCRAETCAPLPTLVVTSLRLDGTVGFDLNNLDEDDNLYTHRDNQLG